MSHSLLIAFVMFATVMFFTPGPNNIMLLSSGLTYGFRPTLPHVAGITFGFAFMIGAVGLGLGTVFIAYPVLQTILKWGGIAYLVYLAATRHSHANRSNIGAPCARRSRRLPAAKLSGEIIRIANAPTLKS